MLDTTTFTFLKKLSANNNKAWMDEHRNDYEKARNNFIEFVKEMIIELSAIDNSLSALNAKDCIFRINRDIRFSKDKRPYKNNFAAYFNKGGKKGPGAGYYLHAEPGKCFMACGVWMPEPKMLADIRQEIDYNYKEFESILKGKKFKTNFESGLDESDILSRPPKGYEADNPAVGYLKLKSFIVRKDLSEKDFTKPNSEKDFAKVFQTAKPMIDFINRSLD